MRRPEPDPEPDPEPWQCPSFGMADASAAVPSDLAAVPSVPAAAAASGEGKSKAMKKAVKKAVLKKAMKKAVKKKKAVKAVKKTVLKAFQKKVLQSTAKEKAKATGKTKAGKAGNAETSEDNESKLEPTDKTGNAKAKAKAKGKTKAGQAGNAEPAEDKEKKLTGHKARIAELANFLAAPDQGEPTSDEPPKKKKLMKRPAAASSSHKELSEGEEDTCSQETNRHRMKQYYMLQCVDQLPEEARKLFDDARRCGNRKEETKMINGIMKKRSNGKGYEIDFKAPIFNELRTKFERKYAYERDKGMIREQMETLLGGSAKFEAAVARGAVKRAEGRDGAEYWVIRQLEAGTETGTLQEKMIDSKHRIEEGKAKQICDMMDSLCWSFKFTEKQQELAVAGDGLPDAALEKLTSAIASVNKLLKNLITTVKTMRPQLSHSLVRQSYDKLCSHISGLRAKASTMEDVNNIGLLAGNPADCKSVLTLLGTVAKDMQLAFEDLQASNGLLSGLKRA